MPQRKCKNRILVPSLVAALFLYFSWTTLAFIGHGARLPRALSPSPLATWADAELSPPPAPAVQQEQRQMQQPLAAVNQQQQSQVQSGDAQPNRVAGRVTYSRLLEFVDEGSVKRIDFYDMGRSGVATVSVGGRVQQLACDLPGATQGLLDRLQQKNVLVEVHVPEKPNPLFNVLGDVAFPLIVIAGLLFLRSQAPGGGGIPGMAGQKKEITIQANTGVTFDDVAGIDEAKEELTEVVDFLKKPERFVKVGAKIPKGVLLTGPPGTGKTLMAKALAGESGVPFIQSSASEFIELFVGVGASRVRDIFKQAKEKDGFARNTGVIVVAATNRSDILDNALLRPGRFDRRVSVDLPDVKGREQILKVHLQNKKLEEGVSVQEVAKRCTGMSGADLENLMNESAILAARRKKKAISSDEINDATDRVVAGIQGSALASNAQKKVFAYHEAGKALVGTMLAYHDPVAKMTLIPRGQRKSLTWFTPDQDQSLISQSSLKARIAGYLGGCAAEQIVFGTGQVTSFAGTDLQQVDRVARAMVTQVGMSSVGQLTIDQGGMMGPSYSEELAGRIDDAIKELSDEGYRVALGVVAKYRDCLDEMADELFEKETLNGAEIREIIQRYTQIPEKLSAV